MSRTRLHLIPSLLLAISYAHADEWHYNNIHLGERALGLAGAYTAIADDASGLYYNPAGISYASDRSLSGSVNTFYHSNKTYQDALSPGLNYERKSSSLLPNFFGVIQPLDKGVVGFSYAVTDSIIEDQDQQFAAFLNNQSFFINVNNRDTTHKIGPSYALAINDKFALGATLYFHHRTYETIVNQWFNKNDGRQFWENYYIEASESGYQPVLGMMWSPIDRLSIGLSLRQTQIVSSDYQLQQTNATPAEDGSDQLLAPQVHQDDGARDTPLTSNLGIAWFASDRLLFSSDFAYYSATTDQGGYSAREATWNIALAAEYYPVANWAVRGGYFSNNANTPKIDTTATNQHEHVDLHGLALSVSRFTRNSSLSVGLNYSRGSGEAQLFSDNSAVQTLKMESVNLFLASSYAF
ncbi:MAG: hypothetical protein HQL49_06615 [Gammaproteobacteria bacterium]|nr:hypothetical protein [Gammaproteobacteria bacterium]